MQNASWSFRGERYELHWNPGRNALGLRWQELLEFPVILPCAVLGGPDESLASTCGDRLAAPFATVLARGHGRGQVLGVSAHTIPVFHEQGLILGSGTREEPGPGLSWRVECGHDSMLIDSAFTNPLPDQLALRALLPFAASLRFLSGGPADWRFFKVASNTSLPCGSVSLGGSERNFGMRRVPQAAVPGVVKRMLTLPGESVSFRKGAFSSQWFTLLVHQGRGPALLLGFLGTRRHFSTVSLNTRAGRLEAAAHGEGALLGPGARFEAHRLLILMGDSPHACLETYVREFAAPVKPRFRPASLWGSWYAGFYDRFQWRDIQANLEAVPASPEPIEFFQLDDGYQRAVGDWTDCRPNLPEGLPGFAREVASRGMKPGIWVAPFAVGRDSSLFRNHPSWVVKKASGRPMLAGVMPGKFRLRPYYGLDLTLPEVQGWLQGLFTTLVDWGFRLFKLDYLAAGAIPGFRADRSATSAAAYAAGLEVIRKAVGDLPIMGALAPQLCGVGLMDIQRVSADSSFGGNHWAPPAQRWLGDAITPGLRNNLRNNLARAFCANRWWTSDCDAILSGGLSEHEQRTHLTVNLLLGDIFQVGFDLRQKGYPWADLSRLRQHVPLLRVVPDLFEAEAPEEALVLARDGRGQRKLFYLLVNLTDAAAQKQLRTPERYLPLEPVRWDRCREFWGPEPMAASPGTLVSLPPHGSLLLELPVDL